MDNINFSNIKNTSNSLDVKGYFLKVLAYWKLFIASFLISFVIAKFMSDYLAKKYSLDTTISVKEVNNPLFSTGTNIAFNWGGASDEVETVKVVLLSRTHNEKVVKKLKFYVEYLQDDKYRQKDVYGYTPFEVDLDVTKPQLYEKLISIELIGEETFRLSFNFNESQKNNLITYSNNSLSTFKSNKLHFSKEFKVGEKVSLPFLNFNLKQIKSFPLGQKYYIRFGSFDSAVDANRNISVVSITKAASMLKLSKSGGNKARIVDYLNTTVQVLEEDKKAQNIAYAVKTQAYIDTLFAKETIRLKNLEKNLGAYKVKNNIFDLSIQGSSIYEETLRLKKQKNELKSYNDYLLNLEKYISFRYQYDSSSIPVPAIISVQDPKIETALSELILKSTVREGVRNSVTDNHPEIIKIDNEIAILKRNLKENISSLIQLNNTRISRINDELREYDTKLKELPQTEQTLITFQRDYSISEANYNYLKQKSYEAGTAIAANVSDVKIIDTAKDLGQGPVYPRPSYNFILALIFGTIIPLFFIVVKELLDHKIHTPEDIIDNYQIPFLGVVGKNTGDNNLAVFERPMSSVSESFRAIRSNIQFLFKTINTSSSKTLLLTSSVSGEGKTMISINMATAFALSGKKTVLVGLDLRKPKIFDDFNLPNDVGVVNHIIKQKELKDIIISSKVPNLDIVLSGPIPPNPSELLLNKTSDIMIKTLQKDYDYVIIDSPPVGLVSDALELFKYADAILYVVRQGVTEKGMLKMIDMKYKNKEVSNISYVLNDFSIKNSYSYGYGYGYGYAKYGNGYHKNEPSKGIRSTFKNLFRSKK